MYRFHFDGYLGGNACGWALDLDNPCQPVALGVYADGKLVGSGEADSFRKDLLLAGIGDGSCAFALPVGAGVCGNIEVRILADGTVLPGSQKNYATADPFANVVLKGCRFESYIQFRSENLKVREGAARPPRLAKRLSRAFSRTVAERDGVRYSAHMNWMCSRLRRGAPSFFSRKRAEPLDDLYWYLFECKEPSKTFADCDYETVSDPVFPRFSGLAHHTVLFDLWLHRAGRQLTDIRVDSLRASFDFGVDLLSAHSRPPTECGLEKRDRSSGVRGDDSVVALLPALTAYLRGKWERGYREHYRLEALEGYLGFLFDCALHAVSAREIALFGQDVLAFFRAPIVLRDGVVSRFALICHALAIRASNRQQADLSSLSARQVNAWFEDVWLALHPLHDVFHPPAVSGEGRAAKGGVCYVIAHWDTSSGLTQNAHMSAKALAAAGIAVIKLLPDGTLFGRSDVTPEQNGMALARDVVLLHVNADDAPAALYGISGQVDLDAAFVIGYFLWELETIPEAHWLGIDLVDEIWVPTDFVADAYRSVSLAKVQKVGKGISVPEIASADRGKFSLGKDAKVFLVSFDFHSSVERKNPVAAVKAFQMAFADRDDVCLVLKSTRFQPEHWGDPFDQWGQIAEYVVTDKRIVLIEEFLPDREMFELIMAADVIVSPHRAEGFGYLPAYGLLYGKQVVVTGYSGTCDYCNDENARIARYDLVRVPNGRFVYQVPDAVWAEVDISSLAACMKGALEAAQKKASAPKPRGKVARRASTAELFSYSRLREKYLERLRIVGAIQ